VPFRHCYGGQPWKVSTVVAVMGALPVIVFTSIILQQLKAAISRLHMIYVVIRYDLPQSAAISRNQPRSVAVSREHSRSVAVSCLKPHTFAFIRVHSRPGNITAGSDLPPSTASPRAHTTPVPCRIRLRAIDRSGRIAFALFSHTTVHCKAYDKRVESLVGPRSATTVHPGVCCTSSLCTEFGRTAWRAPTRTRFVTTFHIW
jgi:hypothetical protein